MREPCPSRPNELTSSLDNQLVFPVPSRCPSKALQLNTGPMARSAFTRDCWPGSLKLDVNDLGIQTGKPPKTLCRLKSGCAGCRRSNRPVQVTLLFGGVSYIEGCRLADTNQIESPIRNGTAGLSQCILRIAPKKGLLAHYIDCQELAVVRTFILTAKPLIVKASSPNISPMRLHGAGFSVTVRCDSIT